MIKNKITKYICSTAFICILMIGLLACGNETVSVDNVPNSGSQNSNEVVETKIDISANSNVISDTTVVDDNICGSWKYSDSIIYHFDDDNTGSIDYYLEDGTINVVNFTYTLDSAEKTVTIMYDESNGIIMNYVILSDGIEMSGDKYIKVEE